MVGEEGGRGGADCGRRCWWAEGGCLGVCLLWQTTSMQRGTASSGGNCIVMSVCPHLFLASVALSFHPPYCHLFHSFKPGCAGPEKRRLTSFVCCLLHFWHVFLSNEKIKPQTCCTQLRCFQWYTFKIKVF